MRAKNLALKLSGPHNQWTASIPAESQNVADGRRQSVQIVIDTHFEGLTPFNSFDHHQQHQVKYVLSPTCFK